MRLEGLSLSESFGADEHIAALLELATDPNAEIRGAIADATRQHTTRIRRTVSRKTYTFLDMNQNPRIFEVLTKLTEDESPTVRLKAAYALGDHPGQKTATLLDRLLLDHTEEVRRAADHAKARLAEQAAVASAYEAAVREKELMRRKLAIRERDYDGR